MTDDNKMIIREKNPETKNPAPSCYTWIMTNPFDIAKKKDALLKEKVAVQLSCKLEMKDTSHFYPLC